ncbi:DUF4307 domain-containing protein [Leucobacter aridicollis]|uniref:DUF4307 domain-containing protein n=1 Tax=Leucobacter aridicollis TaxID=283878 RepID=UPI002103F934|nr:DUF4307 domain-containing protein [Leucobacter aridicollis]UTX53658.1 DUF4307 domain-containing protein [Leucobacter aridicollis]
MTETASDTVADRYGASRSKRWDRRIGWSLASVAILVGLLVIAFGNWRQSTTEFQNIGFTLHNEGGPGDAFSASTKFEVNADPGVAVSCAVEALNTSKATVGWKIVDLPVIDGRSQTVSVDIVTLGPATAAHAKACWPVER